MKKLKKEEEERFVSAESQWILTHLVKEDFF